MSFPAFFQAYFVNRIRKIFPEFLIHKRVFGQFRRVQVKKTDHIPRQVIEKKIPAHILAGKQFLEESVMRV